jgi:hypothetical protein
MRAVYFFFTLAVMVSGVLSAELTGVEFTFYSGMLLLSIHVSFIG